VGVLGMGVFKLHAGTETEGVEKVALQEELYNDQQDEKTAVHNSNDH
jgi:hypothetical protein